MGVQINGDTGNVIATKGTFSGDVGIGGTLTYEDVTNIDAVGIITARSGIEIGARPGVAASISVDGNAIFSGITTVGSKIEVTNDTHGNLNAVLARGADPTFQLQSRNDQHSNSPQTGIGTFGAFYSDNEIIALSFMRGTGAAGAGSLGIIQAGEEKIRINQSGYLGIGTDDPNTELEIQSATDPKIRLQSQEAGNKRLDLYVDGGEAVGTIAADQSSSQLAFRTSGSEHVRITSAGEVLINQATANTYVDGAGYSQTPLLQVISNDNTSTMMSLRYNSGAGAANRRATFALARTADGSAVSDNSVLGEVLFMGEGNNALLKAGSVRAEVDGSPGASDMPGRLVFSTVPDGSATLSERVRIDNAGLVGIGASSTGARLHISDTGTDGGIKLVDSSQSSGSPNLEIIAKRVDSNVNTSFSANIYLGKNRTDQKLTDGMRLGSINFGGNHTDGTEDNISYSAAIRGQASGNFDSKSDMPTDLVFTTGNTGTDRTGETAANSNVGTERLRIISSGQILTGDDTASTNFHDPQTTVNRTPQIQIHGGNSVHASAALVSWNSNAGSYYSNALYLAHSGSSTIGTNSIVSGSNTLGSIVFSGDDGDEFIKGAMISAHVDGTPGADDMPARLMFYTNAGSDTLSERARIDTNGHFFVDCTSEPTQGDSGVRITNGSYHTFARATNTASILRSFGNNGEFRTLGNGNAQNTNNSYGQISDASLKENIVDANSQWNDIKAVKVRNFNFKESTGYNTHKQIGVVAQELEASGLNGLVEINPDELYIAGDEIPDGKNIGDVKEKGYKTVKYSVLYMKAIKALQEAIAKIETLEAEVAALKSN